ncbi:MAG: hypothetical protein ACREUU_15515, partial [Gammaproteobacteria bacterium]
EMILVTGSAGVVEIVDPATLETLGRIRFPFAPETCGLNGVFASSDGSIVYVEGPIPSQPNVCGSLYSIEIGTWKMRVVASVPGSPSRDSLVFSDGLVYPAPAFKTSGLTGDIRNSQLLLSPDGRWLFGVRSHRGPTVAVYDLLRGQTVGELTPVGLEGDWWPSGTWSGERFYFHASTSDGASRMWTVLPGAKELGEGVTVEPFGQLPGCAGPQSRRIVAAAGNIFIYELFGFKGDRRKDCAGKVPGGAWMIDPQTGRLISQIAPDVYFSALIRDRAQSTVYALAASGALLKIDARDGHILKSRALGPGFLRIGMAPLRSVPAGDVVAMH